MIVKTVTMSELKNKGEVPKSPDKIHRESINKGNYNRWNLLGEPRQRIHSEGKRRLDEEEPLTPNKAPRLDEAMVIQLSKSENNIKEIRKVMQESRKAGDHTYSESDKGMGTAFHKLWQAVDLLVSNQEVISSMIADQVKFTDQVSKDHAKVTTKVKEVEHHVMSYAGAAQRNSGGNAQQKQVRVPPTEDDKCKKRIRQAINKSEKATLLMGLDLGDAPTMNKETLA